MEHEVWFHVDMDAFYASVEQLDNPSLAGKPVIVGGSVGQRGVVSACSYEARTFGVHSAMPMYRAKQLCPSAVICKGRMDRYQQVSRWIMEILHSFAPYVQQISIDEAFLEMTGTESLYGKACICAERLKKTIRETVGLTVSVGIGSSKFIAKMASDADKPDGLYQIHPGEETAFIDSMEIEDIWGLGRKSCERIRSYGYRNASQLRKKTEARLQQLFGIHLGSYLFLAVRGMDPGIFKPREGSQSISSEQTFPRDITDRDELFAVLLDLSHQVMFRAMDEGMLGYTAVVKYKLHTFESFTVQHTLEDPVYSADELYTLTKSLLDAKWDGETPLRLLGAGITSLIRESSGLHQGTLFDEDRESKRRSVEQAVFKLKQRGRSVTKASSLRKDFEKK